MTPKHLDDIERAVERMQSEYYSLALAEYPRWRDPKNELLQNMVARCNGTYQEAKLAYQDTIARARASMATE